MHPSLTIDSRKLDSMNAFMRQAGAILVMLATFPALAQADQAYFQTTVSNNQVTISKYTGSGGNLEIPATIDDLPVTSIGGNAFKNCDGLLSVTIPPSVTTISGGAFAGCTRMYRVTIPEGVTAIGRGAFHGCISLTSVTLPQSLTNDGGHIFSQCTELKSITVAGQNPAFVSSDDGVLFNRHQTVLLEYPPGKESSSYTVPDGINRIDVGAFQGCNNLTRVVFPKSVKSIGFWAFWACPNLTSAVFEGDAPKAEGGIFSSVSRDFTVYYHTGAAGFSTPLWTDSAGNSYPTLVRPQSDEDASPAEASTRPPASSDAPAPTSSTTTSSASSTQDSPFGVAVPNAAPPVAPTNGATASTTAKLKTLKDAYDQGLITKEVYDQKVKEVLDGM